MKAFLVIDPRRGNAGKFSILCKTIKLAGIKLLEAGRPSVLDTKWKERKQLNSGKFASSFVGQSLWYVYSTGAYAMGNWGGGTTFDTNRSES
jgi:hypothetical protein